MIAKIDIKKCPFRKIYEVENHSIISKYITNFEECYEKECMAWSEKERTCLLCRKEENED